MSDSQKNEMPPYEKKIMGRFVFGTLGFFALFNLLLIGDAWQILEPFGLHTWFAESDWFSERYREIESRVSDRTITNYVAYMVMLSWGWTIAALIGIAWAVFFFIYLLVNPEREKANSTWISVFLIPGLFFVLNGWVNMFGEKLNSFGRGLAEPNYVSLMATEFIFFFTVGGILLAVLTLLMRLVKKVLSLASLAKG